MDPDTVEKMHLWWTKVYVLYRFTIVKQYHCNNVQIKMRISTPVSSTHMG